MEPTVEIDGQQNGADPNDLPIHKYVVATLYTRAVEHEGEKNFEFRLAQLECEATDSDGAEWMGKHVCDGDDQMPEGFRFAQAIATKIKESDGN